MSINARCGLVVMLVVGIGSLHADPIGTGFTYQGVLVDGADPANGLYDFRFDLFDDPVGGNQIGGSVFVENLSVADGRVTAILDFGDVYGGSALWLEVHVRKGNSTGPYTTLEPRQSLTPGPYSRHAHTAETASGAAQLGGHDPSYYLAWANLTGVPVGLEDGDDDTLGALGCSAGEIARWDGAAWICDADQGATRATYRVGPVGTDLENGTALLQAVHALPGVAPKRLEIEPGTYDLGDQYLEVASRTVIVGSGPWSTSIISDSCLGTIEFGNIGAIHGVHIANSCMDSTSGWAQGVDSSGDTVISNVIVEIDGSARNKTGIVVNDGTATITDTIVRITGGSAEGCTGIGVSGGAVHFNDVDVGVTGCTVSASGINVNSPVDFNDVRVDVSSNSDTAYGCFYSASPYHPDRLSGIRATAVTSTGTAYGILVQASTDDPVEIVDVDARAPGPGPGQRFGLYLRQGVPTLDRVTVQGDPALYYHCASTLGFTLRNSTIDSGDTAIWIHALENPDPVRIENSLLTGPDHTIYAAGQPVSVAVAGSKLAGGPISVPGTATCAGVWDEAFAFHPDSCP